MLTMKIRIQPAEGAWVVRAGGAVIGESAEPLELIEENHLPVIYFPREDIAMELLEPSETRTRCPWKGEAVYFDVVAESGVIRDAAWSYETPLPGAERIAGHIAFHPNLVTLEEL